MADLFQIIDWQECFESHRTRVLDKQHHCLVPNKQNGEGYTQLLVMENGEAMYGAFHAIILYLSRQPYHNRLGYLTVDGSKDGDPLTFAALAKEIKFSESTVKSMLDTIVNDIGWIVNHSKPSKMEAISYPLKRVGIQFIAMAQKFHKIQVKYYPQESGLQAGIKAKTNLVAARELEFLHIEIGVPVERIQAVLDWIPTNSFWKTQCRTLIRISKQSRSNSGLKFQNAEAIMEQTFQQALLTMDQVQDEMRTKNTSADDYEEVNNPRSKESLWRRIN